MLATKFDMLSSKFLLWQFDSQPLLVYFFAYYFYKELLQFISFNGSFLFQNIFEQADVALFVSEISVVKDPISFSLF